MGQDRAVEGSRAATIAFTLAGMRCSDAVKRLVEKDIAVRNGHFYALRCLEALGIQDTDEGIIRISLVHYNTEEEVSRLVEGLDSFRKIRFTRSFKIRRKGCVIVKRY
jgi:selenocysteine lyase/cysteine desulfurase